MIKRLLLWLLEDEIVRIADARISKAMFTKDDLVTMAFFPTLDEDLAPATPLVSVDLEQSPDNAKEKELPFYYHDVLRLLNEGLTDHEVYKKVYMAITDIQYQDALGWAKEQREAEATAPAVQDDAPLVGTSQKRKRGGRLVKYDAKAIADALQAGQKPSVVAKAHGISEPTVYKIKREMAAGTTF